jgi:hypothetical protein
MYSSRSYTNQAHLLQLLFTGPDHLLFTTLDLLKLLLQPCLQRKVLFSSKGTSKKPSSNGFERAIH